MKLINADCLEILRGGGIEDNSIDCILTDPPYNISRETNFHTLKGAIRLGIRNLI